MTARVKRIAEQVKALPDDEREEFLSWLADFEAEHSDDWDIASEQSHEDGRARYSGFWNFRNIQCDRLLNLFLLNTPAAIWARGITNKNS